MPDQPIQTPPSITPQPVQTIVKTGVTTRAKILIAVSFAFLFGLGAYGFGFLPFMNEPNKEQEAAATCQDTCKQRQTICDNLTEQKDKDACQAEIDQCWKSCLPPSAPFVACSDSCKLKKQDCVTVRTEKQLDTALCDQDEVACQQLCQTPPTDTSSTGASVIPDACQNGCSEMYGKCKDSGQPFEVCDPAMKQCLQQCTPAAAGGSGTVTPEECLNTCNTAYATCKMDGKTPIDTCSSSLNVCTAQCPQAIPPAAPTSTVELPASNLCKDGCTNGFVQCKADGKYTYAECQQQMDQCTAQCAPTQTPSFSCEDSCKTQANACSLQFPNEISVCAHRMQDCLKMCPSYVPPAETTTTTPIPPTPVVVKNWQQCRADCNTASDQCKMSGKPATQCQTELTQCVSLCPPTPEQCQANCNAASDICKMSGFSGAECNAKLNLCLGSCPPTAIQCRSNCNTASDQCKMSGKPADVCNSNVNACLSQCPPLTCEDNCQISLNTCQATPPPLTNALARPSCQTVYTGCVDTCHAPPAPVPYCTTSTAITSVASPLPRCTSTGAVPPTNTVIPVQTCNQRCTSSYNTCRTNNPRGIIQCRAALATCQRQCKVESGARPTVTPPLVQAVPKKFLTILAVNNGAESGYEDNSWERTLKFKENNSIQIFEAAIWNNGNANNPDRISLYKFDRTFDPFQSAYLEGGPLWVSYRERFNILNIDTPTGCKTAQGAAYYACSAAYRDAFERIFRTIVQNQPAEHYGIKYLGHGSNSGLFNNALSESDSQQFMAYANSAIGKKLDFLDWSTACSMGTYEVVSSQYRYADYILSSDLQRGGFAVDWVQDYYRLKPEAILNTFFSSTKTIRQALVDMVDSEQSLWETPTTKSDMTANQTKQSLSIYDSSKFEILRDSARLGQMPSGDVLQYIQRTYPAQTQKFFDFRFHYTNNKAFFPWDADSNGFQKLSNA